jgi:hypothetical protein
MAKDPARLSGPLRREDGGMPFSERRRKDRRQRIRSSARGFFVARGLDFAAVEGIASHNRAPCDVRTFSCRSFARISAGLCLFYGVDPPSSLSRL